jgi:hypothetical protein
MQNPALAWILIGIGVGLALISGFAFPLGLGQNLGFGWKKMLGVIIGALIVVAGLYLRRRSTAQRLP